MFCVRIPDKIYEVRRVKQWVRFDVCPRVDIEPFVCMRAIVVPVALRQKQVSDDIETHRDTMLVTDAEKIPQAFCLRLAVRSAEILELTVWGFSDLSKSEFDFDTQ